MNEQKTNQAQAAYVPGNVPMGTIVAFILNKSFLPAGWLMCNGSVIPAQYQSLITALGSPYTPNLAGRTLVGTGTPYNGIQSDGTIPNFDPDNDWPLSATGGQYARTRNAGNATGRHYYGNNGHDSNNYLYESMLTRDTPTEQKQVGSSTTEALRNPGAADNNMQPYFAINYIIYAGQ